MEISSGIGMRQDQAGMDAKARAAHESTWRCDAAHCAAGRLMAMALLLLCSLLPFAAVKAQGAPAPEGPRVAAGWGHTCTIREAEGTVWCWGENYFGQLGNDSTQDSSTPVQVAGLSNVAALMAGGFHTCALKLDRTLWCWGNNNDGQLGDGNIGTSSSIPVQVLGENGTGVLTDITALATGHLHTCALQDNGTHTTLRCWGNNNAGQLGDNTYESRATPTRLLDENSSDLGNVRALAAGYWHTCALRDDGSEKTVWCWGNNAYGQLANGGRMGELKMTVPAQGEGGTGVLRGATALVANREHTCALKDDETVSCWGNNDHGQLGNEGAQAWSTAPVPVQGEGGIGFLSAVSALAAGTSHTCALKDDGTGNGAVWCWGGNNHGQLGNVDIGSTPSGSTTPVPVQAEGGVGVMSDVSALAAGDRHACALKNDSTLLCWGDNFYGQLGNADTRTGSTIPVHVEDLSDASALAAGTEHTCALKDDHTIWCWGDNELTQFGDGSSQDSFIPVQVASLSDAIALAAGDYHTCALKDDQTVWCWGWAYYGQLGDGNYYITLTPVQVVVAGQQGSVPLGNVSALAAGGNHVCALKSDKTVWCWGANYAGQLGIPASDRSLTAVQVAGLSDTLSLAAGNAHSCALRDDGGNRTVWCWGSNDSGQLGNSTAPGDSNPVQVTGEGGIGFLRDVIAVVAGDFHTCALKDDQTAWCWGENHVGQLGNGSTVGSPTPVQVTGEGGIGFLHDANVLAAGDYHTCALKDDQTAWCWGYNAYGQLGNGSTVGSSSPVQVTDLSGAIALAVGAGHTCAVAEGRTVWCWGENSMGQLGLTPGIHTPQRVLFPGAIEISPASLAATQSPGATSSQSLTIHNPGTVDLEWSIAEVPDGGVCTSPADVTWLSAAPVSGALPAGEDAGVAVSFDATGLAPGHYNASLCVSSNAPLLVVPVTLEVLQPVVSLTYTPPNPTTADAIAFSASMTNAVSGSRVRFLFKQGAADYAPAACATNGDVAVDAQGTAVCSVTLAQAGDYQWMAEYLIPAGQNEWIQVAASGEVDVSVSMAQEALVSILDNGVVWAPLPGFPSIHAVEVSNHPDAHAANQLAVTASAGTLVAMRQGSCQTQPDGSVQCSVPGAGNVTCDVDGRRCVIDSLAPGSSLALAFMIEAGQCATVSVPASIADGNQGQVEVCGN